MPSSLTMNRREALALLGAAAVAGPAVAAPSPVGTGPVAEALRQEAQALAARPYRAASTDLPKALAEVDYDAYRDLRFQPAKALWRGMGLPFEVQMFHRGGLFRDRVDLYEAVDGELAPIAYSRDLFDFGPRRIGDLPPDVGFAGFRLHGAINRADYLDEICAFLGASYFRAVGRGDAYGLSARALALGGAEAGEEFPRFTKFVLERPGAGDASAVFHGLLDSDSVAGAYSFRVTAGQPTTMEVAASLFPRKALARAGVAPLTSMYLFAAEQPRRFDDFRPEVHDSDGLAFAGADGARLWRPLINPARTQTTALAADRPAGFGLMQRQRALSAYEDFEANYHRRPGAWVTPISGFDDGEVRLVELPAHTEFQDNVFAAWRPAQPLAAGREHRFAYRLDWGQEGAPSLARVLSSRSGLGESGGRRFVIDFTSTPDKASPRVVADAGEIVKPLVQPNAATGGVRLSFELRTGSARTAELKAALVSEGGPVSETWFYRWLA